MRLPSKSFKLPDSDGRVHERSPSKADIVAHLVKSAIVQHHPGNAHIGSIFTNKLRNRSDVPNLRHAQDCACPTHQEGDQCCNTQWEFLLIVPHGPIEATLSSKDEVFFKSDGHPDGHPVTHESKEVGEDLCEVPTTSKRTDRIDDHPDRIPDGARHYCCPVPEDLCVDTRRIPTT